MYFSFVYNVLLLLLCVFIILICLVWVYRTHVSVYSQFPSYMVDFRAIWWFLTEKSELSLTALLFQKLLNESHKFVDGIFVLWIPSPYILIFNEDIVKTLCTEHEATDKPALYDLTKPYLGTGLFTSNGERWRKHRKMINPVFHVHSLKDKIPVFNKHSQILVQKMEEDLEKSSVEILPYLQSISFGILCESLLGLNVSSGEYSSDISEFTEAVLKLSEFTSDAVLQPWLYWKPFLMFSPSRRRDLKYFETFSNFPKKVMTKMKESIIMCNAHTNVLKDDSETENKNRKSIAEMLVDLHLKDKTFTMDDMFDQIKIFMGAGFDTVAHALKWTIFLLGHHPDVQEKVANEIESVVNGEVTFDDIFKLTYLECVIMESLRLCPVVPVYGRFLRKDIQYGKYKIPKNSDVMIVPYLLHRNPDLYPDPENFDPDRFMGENLGKRPFIFIPFAEGIRSCIGKKYALLEMKVILAYVFKTFKIVSVDSRKDVILEWNFFLSTVKPLRMKFELRKSETLAN